MSTTFQGANEQKDKKKKVSTKTIELGLEGRTHGYSVNELQNYYEQETKMIANDAREKERIDARNALEEYVYDMRDKLQEDGFLSPYINDIERTNICSELNALESWIYEEGENCDRDIYKEKLSELHSRTDPIKMRCHEYETQPSVFEELGHAIQMARKAVDEFRSGAPKYDHLTETEFINISEAADKAQKWFEDARAKLAHTPKTADPPIKLIDIRHELQTLTTCVNSVINRPKPKLPTPPANNQKQNATSSDAAENQSEDQNGEVSSNNKGQQQQHDKRTSNHCTEETMDVE